MTMLCLAVVSAIALKHMNTWFSKFRREKALSLLFLIFLTFTFLTEVNMLPYPVVENASVPAFYANLADISGTFAVLDLPQDYHANNRYMYYGTISEKPLVGGSISRIAPKNLQFLQVFPLISQMDYVENGEDAATWTDIFLQDVNMTNLLSFEIFNVKFVVLHKDILDDGSFEKMNAYLNDLLGKPVFSDEKIIAFSTKPTQLHSSSAFCLDGWWNRENRNGLAMRWMDGRGIVEIVSPSDQFYDVDFIAGTMIESKSLKVFLNGEEVGNFQVSPDAFSQISLKGLYFKKDANELVFYSERTFIPAVVLPDSVDTRRLSIALQNVSILPK